MHRNIVTEILPAHDNVVARAIVGQSVGKGEAGVVIKATQGIRYYRADASELFDDAELCATFAGWLHYCEPGANSPDDEAVTLMGWLGARPLELGIWLELDDLQGEQPFAVVEWVTQLVKAVSTPTRPACLVVDPTVVASMSGLPQELRIVLTRPSDTFVGTPWAVRLADPIECHDGVELVAYGLNSTRGLVPTQAVSAPEGRSELQWHEDPAKLAASTLTLTASANGGPEDDDEDEEADEHNGGSIPEPHED